SSSLACSPAPAASSASVRFPSASWTTAATAASLRATATRPWGDRATSSLVGRTGAGGSSVHGWSSLGSTAGRSNANSSSSVPSTFSGGYLPAPCSPGTIRVSPLPRPRLDHHHRLLVAEQVGEIRNGRVGLGDVLDRKPRDGPRRPPAAEHRGGKQGVEARAPEDRFGTPARHARQR